MYLSGTQSTGVQSYKCWTTTTPPATSAKLVLYVSFWYTVNWYASCKCWTTTHTTKTRTGSKKGVDGTNGGGSAAAIRMNTSLKLDGLHWIYNLVYGLFVDKKTEIYFTVLPLYSTIQVLDAHG
jgi:hypothetical protein